MNDDVNSAGLTFDVEMSISWRDDWLRRRIDDTHVVPLVVQAHVVDGQNAASSVHFEPWRAHLQPNDAESWRMTLTTSNKSTEGKTKTEQAVIADAWKLNAIDRSWEVSGLYRLSTEVLLSPSCIIWY